MRLLLFGPGYTGSRIAAAFADRAEVLTIGRRPPPDLPRLIAGATHIVSTVPPGQTGDPVLALLRKHGLAVRPDAIEGSLGPPAGEERASTRSARTDQAEVFPRLIYLSSTGVYGDAGGGWVDESAPLAGRRPERIAADRAWRALGAVVLRLPGIYGPGRSIVDRLLAGQAHRVDLPHQVFSRVHVDDIVAAVLAAATRLAEPGAYNIADDRPCGQNELVDWAAPRLGIAPPPLRALDDAGLSPAARAFYAENRRVANGKARRLLGWRPLHPDYRAGLRALIATARPNSTSAAPATASMVQR